MISKPIITDSNQQNDNLFLWTKVVVFNFLIAALIGVSLRLAFVVEIPNFHYKNILHAHSHVALLGWLFCGIVILIIHAYGLNSKNYKNLFWGFQLCVLGMLLSFPKTGYGVISIACSTIHILLSYIFIYRLTHDQDCRDDKLRSKRWLMASLFFLLLASLGTWALGPIMNSSLKGGSWYYASIQFFLHFQFNGWFIFTIIAIFLKTVSNSSEIQFSNTLTKSFYILITSCFFTYALAVTWSNPDKILFWINSLGVILQLVAWIYFITWIKSNTSYIKRSLNKQTQYLWSISFICLTLKIVIQTMVAIPAIAVISYTIHNFVIGFIHLLMLGCLSLFIWGYFSQINIWTKRVKLRNTGIWIFILGVGFTELLLFSQGLLLWLKLGFIPHYYKLILFLSIFLPLGILLYWLSILKSKKAKR